MKKKWLIVLSAFLMLIIFMSSVNAADGDDTKILSQNYADEYLTIEVSSAGNTSGLELDSDENSDSSLIKSNLNEQALKANNDENVLTSEHYVTGSSFSDIQDAIDNAHDGDIIFLNGFTYSGTSVITINKELTIIGGSSLTDTQKATLDANNVSSIFKVIHDKVNIKNIIFLNGITAISMTGANGNVSDCIFENNTAANNGGAIYWNGANGTVSNCNFINNTATSNGGAICWENSDNGIIFNCNFADNMAKNDIYGGGAIYWHYSDNGAILNSNFINNGVKGTGTHSYYNCNGGAIYWHHSDNGTVHNNNFTNNIGNWGGAINWDTSANGNVTDCSFVNNTGKVYGGAIRWYGTNGSVSGCIFMNNTADHGGAINWYNSTEGTVFNCNFTNNTANHNWGGGAIFWSDHSHDGAVYDCNFINNTAHNNGGAIYWRESDDGKVYNNNFTNNTARYGGAVNWDTSVNGNVSDCSFENNTGTNYGGAIRWYGTNGAVSDCSFMNNTGGYYGGAISWASSTYGKINNSNFTNNTANWNGGAIHWENSNYGAVSDCSFMNNTGGYYGGAIHWVSSTYGKINNSNFTNNTANWNGGAIHWENSNYGTVTDCTFKNNTADYGGAIEWNGTEGTVSNSNFADNYVKYYGGAIHWASSTYGKINNSNFTNNTGGYYGGAIHWENSDYSTVTECAFENNTAVYYGGAINWEGANGKVSSSNFTNNYAGYNGGAINWDGANGNISLSKFVKNRAARGGAIEWKNNGQSTVSDSYFIENKANSYRLTPDISNSSVEITFTGYEIYMNAIYTTIKTTIDNVTYWNGSVVNSDIVTPTRSSREVGINITIEVYDSNNILVDNVTLVTDERGIVPYYYTNLKNGQYIFNAYHLDDAYYTYINTTGSFTVEKPFTNLTIVKYANVTTDIEVYSLVNFTINVTNLGPSNATNVNITDVLPDGLVFVSAGGNVTGTKSIVNGKEVVTWMIGNLNKDEMVSLWVVVNATTDGKFKNVAIVNSTENPTGSSNETEIVVKSVVNLTIVKSSNWTNNTGNHGDLVNFTIVVTNNGPSTATNVNITDILDSNFEYIATDGSYNIEDHKVIWNIGTLINGASCEVWVVVKSKTNGTFRNTATVNSTEDPTGPSDEIEIIVEPVTKLSVIKYANVTGNVNVTNLVKFTINVTNDGPSNATWVIITDDLVEEFEFVNATGNWTRNGQKVTWTIPRLNNGTTVSVDLIIRILTNGTFENVAFAKSSENITEVSNKTNVTAEPIVDLKVNKTVNMVEAFVGDNIKYTIYVVNNGPCNATDVYVTDKLHKFLYFISFESNRTDITYDKDTGIAKIGNLNANEAVVLYIVAKVIDVGEISNMVYVTSNETDTNLTNNNFTCENVTADKRLTPIYLEACNIYYGEVEILNVTLPKGATGTVNITVNGIPYNNIPINEGIATLPLPNLGGGDYNVEVVYGGNDEYVGNSTEGLFKVLPLTPTIKIEVVDIWYGEIEILNVTVNAPGTVNITVNGITIEVPLNQSVTTTTVLKATLDYNGKATWNLVNLPVGTYPAFAAYNGNENYTSVNTSDVFTVKPLPTTVTVTAEDIYVGEDALIKVEVGPKGLEGNVTITLEGKKYTVNITDGKGKLVVSGLKAGTKHVSAIYWPGNTNYLPSKNKTTFKVSKIVPPINSKTQDIEYGEDETIIIHLPDDATGTVTIIVDGKTYRTTLKDGKATFKIPGLKPGKYNVDVYYSGDDKYLSTDTIDSFKVSEKQDPNPVPDKGHNNGIDLNKNATGNPIFILVMLLLAVFVGVGRKLKI